MTKRRDNDLSNGQPIESSPRKRPGPRCTAHKKNGEQCKNNPIRGSNVCRFHGGAAKSVREKANERLLEMVMPALNRIRKIILNPKTTDEVALKAAREILNRTGFSERFAITVAEDRWGDIIMGSLTDDRSGIGEVEDNKPSPFALEKLAEDESAKAWANLDAEDEAERESGRIRGDGHRVVDGEVVSPTNKVTGTDGGLLDRPDPPPGPSEYDG